VSLTTSIFDLHGRTALVTGSTRGLGLALARGLLQAGATVILNGRDADTLNGAVASLADEQGPAVHGAAFDVCDDAAVSRAIDKLEEQVGPIHILVNNAGIQIRGPLESFALPDWQAVINTNLTGAFVVAQALAIGMIKRKSGKIINICSLQSELARPTIAPYAAAKGGLKMLTRAMAAEWAQHNIQVNGIAPGYFKTQMTKPLYENESFDGWLCSRTPARRWGEPQELLGALIFLAADASSYVNGHVLTVDGGLSACV
jgi:gluconate 5-dehydrogenase